MNAVGIPKSVLEASVEGELPAGRPPVQLDAGVGVEGKYEVVVTVVVDIGYARPAPLVPRTGLADTCGECLVGKLDTRRSGQGARASERAPGKGL